MKTKKIVKITISLLLFAVIALFLYYNLPRTIVVQISGTDVKRVDKSSGKVVDQKTAGSKKGTILSTYDLRFINSMAHNGKVMVFRNEDTGWGWPPYFKFDSADLTAKAQALATDPEKPWVLVKYYGWRIRIFSMFPNVVSLKEVKQDYQHIPLFNIIFVSVLIICGIILRLKFRKLIDRLRNFKKSQKNN